MSLHAQLSPDALILFHTQQRNSTITSIIIAILVVLFGSVILLYLLLPTIDNHSPGIVAYPGSTDDEQPRDKPEIPRSIKHKPSPPAASASMANVFASNIRSLTAIPTPPVDTTDPSTDLGNGNDFSEGWNDGDGDGDGFRKIPPITRDRCGLERRLARLDANGGNAQCEEAVMKSLRWLKKTQNPDGSWTGTNQAAMTGFAILAFLGHCETPNSEEFGDAVTRGIVYLVNVGMKNEGRLATSPLTSNHWVYEHGIATYALAEAYTFCNSLGLKLPKLGEVTRQAGDIIIAGQGDSGGWVYRFDSTNGGDNSVGYWQIQALKACKHTKLWKDKDFKTVSRKALAWLAQAQGKDGAIGYRGNSAANPGLTGGGVLAFQMWGKGSSKNVRSGAKYIRANTEFKWEETSANLYYHYYNAQAMINRGGEDWKFYNNLFRDELLNNQKEDGTWKNAATKHSNLHMTTCLATFMLEVYYRFLPATGTPIR
jgi:hypothetical protein